MAEVKITKAMVLEVIGKNVENMTFDGDVTAEDVTAFVETTLAQIAAKAEKNKERAAAKKAEGDELRAEVQAILTEEFQSAQAITDAIGKEDVTKAKVIARLKQLVDTGVAVKEEVKIGDKKQMAYKLA